jgi:hypothetical protein
MPTSVRAAQVKYMDRREVVALVPAMEVIRTSSSDCVHASACLYSPFCGASESQPTPPQ